MNEIVVGVDGSEPSGAALDWAAHEAQRRGSRLRIVHALPPLSEENELPAAEERARRAAPGIEIVTEQVTDGPQEALMERAGSAELVVVGTHGHGSVASLIVGSVAAGLAGSAPVPVVLLKDDASLRAEGPVVVAVPENPVAEVLDAAAHEADLRDLPLRIVHTWWEPPVEGFGAPAPIMPLDPAPIIDALRERLEAELEPWLGKRPGTTLTVVQGHPRDMLIELSGETGLLVLGRHEKPGRHLRALGSVTRSVIHRADCPVMVVGV
ncbi:universal stress protein [Actinocorallia longicatena]|uniref:Universal stress protein n=1 Tax=Actinocorallia longicatena TaxID=111803 RepID=A0ABP6PVW4_9ACTN